MQDGEKGHTGMKDMQMVRHINDRSAQSQRQTLMEPLCEAGEDRVWIQKYGCLERHKHSLISHMYIYM